ncbi:hypothetical protein AAFF_G00087700 [Aldrovandia affinis]|uniref:PHD-type domain-containing protein n=1 Tax=Aldrovandia affinis TaxID=143900 RepID=A0AAD7RWF4_9TELE|nr:hypothetical protein AAFF_G00087700 [Aldrovandia affinis]
MSAEQEKDTLSLKRTRGGDGSLDGLGGPGVLLASPDKKKRKSNPQPSSFPPLSEFAPPPNPGAEHLVAANPFDDSYNAPSLKPLPSGNPYYTGPSHYPGLGGYGPQRMSQMGVGFCRPPGFAYGHHDNPCYGNQPVFNNSSMALPPNQPFRPGPGDGFVQMGPHNMSQSSPPDMGPGFGPEGNAPPPPRPCMDLSPGFMQQQNHLVTMSKQGLLGELSGVKSVRQNVSSSPQKQAEEAAACQDALGLENAKQKSRGAPIMGQDGGHANALDKLNGIIHPGEDSLKGSPQPCASMELSALEGRRRRRRSSSSGAAGGAGGGGGGGVGSNKGAPHPNRPGHHSSSMEPMYPCGICLSEVNDDQEAILCEASCQKWFHRICTGMTETAYNLLTAEASAVWGCDTCMEEKGAPLTRTRELAAQPAVNREG